MILILLMSNAAIFMAFSYLVVGFSAWAAGLDDEGLTKILIVFLYLCSMFAILLPSIGEWLDTRKMKYGSFDAALNQPNKVHSRFALFLPLLVRWLDTRSLQLEKQKKSLAQSFKAQGRLCAALALSGVTIAKIFIPDF